MTSSGKPIQTFWWLVTVTLVIAFVFFASKFWEVYAAWYVGQNTGGVDTQTLLAVKRNF